MTEKIEICIGCKKTIEDTEDNMQWNKEYQKWTYTELGMFCEKCYPVYKNIIPIIKKEVRKYFSDARGDLNFRFKENLNQLW